MYFASALIKRPVCIKGHADGNIVILPASGLIDFPFIKSVVPPSSGSSVFKYTKDVNTRVSPGI